ncbi:MAG: hypothetical protein V4754_10900 [Pseudomonadota bacterium]
MQAAVALVDGYGNLLLCLGGQLARSPIRTAFRAAFAACQASLQDFA